MGVGIEGLLSEVDSITGYKSPVKPARVASKDSLSQDELEDSLRQGGWPEQMVPTMSAIGMAESALTPDGRAKINSYNPGVGPGGVPTVEQSIGPWQINMHPSLKRSYDRKRLAEDPVYNAQVAKEIYGKQGLKAWGSYTDGRYKKFLRSQSSAAPDYSGTLNEVDSILADKAPETASPDSMLSEVDKITGYTGKPSPTFAGAIPNTLAAPKTDDTGFQSESDPAYMATFAQGQPQKGLSRFPVDPAPTGVPQLPSQVLPAPKLKLKIVERRAPVAATNQATPATAPPDSVSTDFQGLTVDIPDGKPETVDARKWARDTGAQKVAEVLGAPLKDVMAYFSAKPILRQDDSTANADELKAGSQVSISPEIINNVAQFIQGKSEQRKAAIAKLVASDDVRDPQKLQDADVEQSDIENFINSPESVDAQNTRAKYLQARQSYAEQQKPVFEADILAKRDSGQFTPEQADYYLKKETEARAQLEKERQSIYRPSNRFEGGNPELKYSSVDDWLTAEGVTSAGEYIAKREKNDKDIYDSWNYLARHPNFLLSEGSTNLARSLPKAVASLSKAVDIAAEIGASFTGDKDADARTGAFYKAGQAINDWTDAKLPQDPKLRGNMLATTIPDVLGQTIAQIGLGIFTGGATAPTMLGAAMGAEQQYDEAVKGGATPTGRRVNAFVGALAAIPDAILFNKWLAPLSGAEKSGFLARLTNSIFKASVKEVGETEALNATREFIKTTLKSSAFEGAQEFSENKIDDLAAKLTYDPDRKILTVNDNDIESTIGGLMGGALGGGFEATAERIYHDEHAPGVDQTGPPQNAANTGVPAQPSTNAQNNTKISTTAASDAVKPDVEQAYRNVKTGEIYKTAVPAENPKMLQVTRENGSQVQVRKSDVETSKQAVTAVESTPANAVELRRGENDTPEPASNASNQPKALEPAPKPSTDIPGGSAPPEDQNAQTVAPVTIKGLFEASRARRAKDAAKVKTEISPEQKVEPALAESLKTPEREINSATSDSRITNEPPSEPVPEKAGQLAAQTVVTERGTKADITPKVIESSDIITSLDPGYPQELQPRNRENRKTSQTQINDIAKRLNPDLLGDSPKAADGRPLVVPVKVDGKTKYAVISGNGRTAAIRQAYDSENQGSADAYRQFVDSRGGKALTKPVYVAELNTKDLDLEKFAREANESGQQAMSAPEQAVSDAKVITKNNLIKQFTSAEDGSIVSKANREFIRTFIGQVIPEAERNRYVDDNYQLSQEGANRVRNAVFASAFGDSERGLSAIQRLAESTNNNVRNITNGLLKSAGKLAELKTAAADGVRHAGLDITNDLASAMEKLSTLKEQGSSVDEYLRQQNLFEDDLSPFQKLILQTLENHNRSPKAVASIIGNYVTMADEAGHPKQSSLFGDEKVDAPAFFQRAIDEYAKGRTAETQADLFGEDKGTEDKSAPLPDSRDAVRPGNEPSKSAKKLAESAAPQIDDYDKHFEGIATEQNKDAVTLNPNALEALRVVNAVMENASDLSTIKASGTFLEPQQVTEVLHHLNDIKSEMSGDTAGLEKFIADIESARKENGTVLLVTPESKTHETIHKATFMGGYEEGKDRNDYFAKSDIENDPDFQSFHSALNEAHGYTLPVGDVKWEALAYLGDNDHARFGLTKDQSDNILTRLVMDYAEKNGVESLEHFSEADAENIFNAIEKVKDAKGKSAVSDERIQQSDQGDSGKEARPPPAESSTVRTRQTVTSAEQAGVIHSNVISGDGRYYTQKSTEPMQARAQSKIERIGIEHAAVDAASVIEKPSDEDITFQWETVHKLNELAYDAVKAGNKASSVLYSKQAEQIVEVLAVQGTEAGRVVQSYNQVKRENAKTVTAYVQKRRKAHGVATELSPEEQAALKDSALELAKTREQVASLEARIRELENRAEIGGRKLTKRERKFVADLTDKANIALSRLTSLPLRRLDVPAVLKSLDPNGLLSTNLLSDLSDVGASILFKGFYGDEIISPEAFKTELLKTVGQKYENNWREIHAASVTKLAEMRKSYEREAAIERVRAESLEPMTDEELSKRVDEDLEKQKDRNKLRAEHRKLANDFLTAPAKAQKYAERQAAKQQDQAEREINKAWQEKETQLTREERARKDEFEKEWKAAQKESGTFLKTAGKDLTRFERQEQERIDKERQPIVDFVETVDHLDLAPSDQVMTGALLLETGKATDPASLAKELRSRFPELASSADDSLGQRKEKLNALNKAVAESAQLQQQVRQERSRFSAEVRKLVKEANGQLTVAKTDRRKATLEFNHLIKTLERPPASKTQKVTQLMRLMMVSAINTAANNAVSGQLTRAMVKLPDMLDVSIQKAGKAFGVEIKNEGLTADTSFWDVMGAPAEGGFKQYANEIIFAHGTIVKALDEHPELFNDLYGDYSSDIKTADELKSRIGGTIDKILDGGIYAFDKLNFANRYQEYFVRDAEALHALQMRIGGAKFAELVKNNKLGEITKEDWQFAIDRARKVTYSQQPPKGSTAEKVLRTLNSAPVPTVIAIPFARFSWNAWNLTREWLPVISSIRAARRVIADSRAEGKTQAQDLQAVFNPLNYTSREMANSISSFIFLAAALGLVRSLGDRDDWYYLKIPFTEGMGRDNWDGKKSSLYVDTRTQPQFAPFLYTANKINRWMNGGDIFNYDDPKSIISELAEPYFSFSYRQAIDQNSTVNAGWYGSAAAFNYLTGKEDVNNNPDKAMYSLMQMLGNYTGLPATPVRPLKNLLDSFLKTPDLDMDKAPFAQGLERNLPKIIFKQAGFDAKKDAVTGKEKLYNPYSFLKPVGINIVDDQVAEPEMNKSLRTARKETSDGNYSPAVTGAEKQARDLKKDIYRAINEATRRERELPEIDIYNTKDVQDRDDELDVIRKPAKDALDRAEKDGVISKGQADYIDRAFGSTELEGRMKGAEVKEALAIYPVILKDKDVPDEEKERIKQIVLKKIKHATNPLTPEQKKKVTELGLARKFSEYRESENVEDER